MRRVAVFGREEERSEIANIKIFTSVWIGLVVVKVLEVVVVSVVIVAVLVARDS